MTNITDEILTRAQGAAKAILQEAGEIRGPVLICEIDGDGLRIVWDAERLHGPTLAKTLRDVADRLDGLG